MQLLAQLDNLDSLVPSTDHWKTSLQKVYLFSMGYFPAGPGLADPDLKPANPNDSGDEESK